MNRRIISIVMLLALAFCLTACAMFAEPTEPPTPPESVHTQPTPEPSVDPSEQEEPPVDPVPDPEPSSEPETEPEHSELYIEGLAVEDVITYFNEVCLDCEYIISGDPSVVQKWMEPIFYVVHGDPTEEDLEVLNEFTVWLNTIEGFPGIYAAQDADYPNLQIYFCSGPDMLELLGENFFYMDGGVTFWYDGENQIYDATICCRTELDQQLRNSVILEEIYNGLGPVQDTALREDSIIYAEFSQPQALTEIDELILRLLYHPDIQCGMNAEECEAVIRKLYY